jgi:multicomponent Na+:H+ antiporter subunit C
MWWLNGEMVSIILFFIGVYGIIARRNIIKTIISIGVMETAVILFFITINYSEGSVPPIGNTLKANIADPLPQALMITAIVIGVAVTAVSLTMFVTLYHKYGTTNWEKVIKRRMEYK